MIFALLAALPSMASEPSSKEEVSDIVFFSRQDDVPTITLMGGYNPGTGAWTKPHPLTGVKVGNVWHFTVPHEYIFAQPQSESAVPCSCFGIQVGELTVDDYVIKAIVAFGDTKITYAVKPTELDLSHSKFFPGMGEKGGSLYVDYKHSIACEGSGCNKLDER